jgi:hypothetical protein
LVQLFKKTIIPQPSLKINPTLEIELSDNCNIVDSDGDSISFEQLELNNEIICNISINGIIFFANRFFIDYLIDGIFVKNSVCQQTEYLFSDSD